MAATFVYNLKTFSSINGSQTVYGSSYFSELKNFNRLQLGLIKSEFSNDISGFGSGDFTTEYLLSIDNSQSQEGVESYYANIAPEFDPKRFVDHYTKKPALNVITALTRIGGLLAMVKIATIGISLRHESTFKRSLSK
jgi:hypothetical protein